MQKIYMTLDSFHSHAGAPQDLSVVQNDCFNILRKVFLITVQQTHKRSGENKIWLLRNQKEL